MSSPVSLSVPNLPEPQLVVLKRLFVLLSGVVYKLEPESLRG